MNHPRVLCIGESLIDLIANPGADLLVADQFAIREGGAPMNVAVGLARLGVSVGFVGVVGDDPFGSRLRTLLDRERVNTTSLTSTPDQATSLALAWRDDRGDGRFQLLRMADRELSPALMPVPDVQGALAIVVGSVALGTEPSCSAIQHAVAIAVEAGVPVVIDVNVRRAQWMDRGMFRRRVDPVLRAADLVKLSLDDAGYLVDATEPELVFPRIAQLSQAKVVLTDGNRGVYVRDDSNEPVRQLPVYEVEAVDPTGAGDAFTAALIARMIDHGWSAPTDDDIRFAMAAGALATTRQGALMSLPSAVEIASFLAARRTGA